MTNTFYKIMDINMEMDIGSETSVTIKTNMYRKHYNNLMAPIYKDTLDNNIV